jgi:hypothetical protein
MPRFVRNRKILIPGLPLSSKRMRDDLAVVGIGILCILAALAAMIFVFFGG